MRGEIRNKMSRKHRTAGGLDTRRGERASRRTLGRCLNWSPTPSTRYVSSSGRGAAILATPTPRLSAATILPENADATRNSRRHRLCETPLISPLTSSLCSSEGCLLREGRHGVGIVACEPCRAELAVGSKAAATDALPPTTTCVLHSLYPSLGWLTPGQVPSWSAPHS